MLTTLADGAYAMSRRRRTSGYGAACGDNLNSQIVRGKMRLNGHTLSTSGALLTTLLAFSVPSAAQAPPPVLTTLYTFTGGVDGSSPSDLVEGPNGVLYGTSADGGQLLTGTVFSLTPPATAGGSWTKTVLYSWSPDEASSPSGVVIGRHGAFYGTTGGGGVWRKGTVYRVNPPSSAGGKWTKTVLHNFGATANDGTSPSGLAVGRDGVLYGTTSGGGTSGNGTVFSLSPPEAAGDAWTEEVLYSFMGSPTDGSQPLGGVVIGDSGVLYGTTNTGGAPGASGCDCTGTIFSLAPPSISGGMWTETMLYSASVGGFANGFNYVSGVVIGAGGALYGVAPYGGIYCNVVSVAGCGVIYELLPPENPGGAWTNVALHAFIAGDDAINPKTALAISPNGTLYGTSYNGGSWGTGVVYAEKPPASPGSAGTEEVLQSFEYGSPSGSSLSTPVTVGRSGLIYGTTTYGGVPGPFGYGTIFSLVP